VGPFSEGGKEEKSKTTHTHTHEMKFFLALALMASVVLAEEGKVVVLTDDNFDTL
jgi:hypothetical protein